MKKIVLLALISVFIFPSACSASEEVARVVAIEGRVDIFRGKSEVAAPIREDEFISVGDSVRTKTGSKVELAFKDKSILKLAQNSKVEIKDYQLDERNRRKTAVIELSRGKVRAIIEKMPNAADFVVTTPNAKGSVKGSDITAFYQTGNSGVFVTEGKLSLINIAHPENQIMVPAGKAALVPLGELPKGPREYLDIEKKLNDEDTNVRVPISKTGKVSVIKGTVAKLSGMVKITNKGEAAGHDATINDIVAEGDRIETGTNGFAEIVLDNNNALNLKPNTKLLILKLVINPSTGEYENIFEVTIGKIRARIEGLKGNSKFEVKTPTAICGARGTLMYLEITPTMAKAFFEGGNGYINNLISGAQTDIGMGNNGSADSQGNNSNPVPTSNEERDDWTQGWDSGNDTAGYSSGDSGANSNLGDTGAGGTNTGTDTGTGGEANNDNGNPYLYIPPENPIQPPAPILPAMSLTGAFSKQGRGEEDDGAFGYYGLDLDPYSDSYNMYRVMFDTNSSMSASLYGAGDLWNTPSMPFVVFGNYSNPENRRLWGIDNLSGETSDGARYQGVIGGIIDNEGNSIEGLSYVIYVRPTANGYKAGYIRSVGMAGRLSPENSFFTLAGYMSRYLDLPTSVSPDMLDESMSSELHRFRGDIGGDVSGTMDGDSLEFADSGWGLWKGGIGGDFNVEAPPQNNWNAVVGGQDEDLYGSASYWIATVSGTGWSNGKLRGTITGNSLSYGTSGNLASYNWGVFSGDTIGVYYSDGSWEGLSAGVYNETPLAFGGETTHEHGVDYALFGGTGSLWTGSPNILFMGDYSAQEAPTRDLWRLHTLGRTSDNAAIYGMAGGTKLGNVLKGLIYAIYIRPNLNSPTGYSTGYIKSTDISGNVYPDIGNRGMFEADGTISRSEFEYATAVSTGELLLYMQPEHDVFNDRDAPIYRDEFIGKVGGDITGTFSGESIGIEHSLTDQMWSIWRIEMSGYSPEPQGAWHAVFGDSAEEFGDTSYIIVHFNGPAWSGNEFSGNVTGKEIWYSPDYFEVSTMASVTGETIGTYANGAWSATSLGISEELPLAFGALLEDNGDITGDFAYYDEQTQWVQWDENSSVSGLMGGVDSLWSGSPEVTIMGEFSNPENRKLWGIDINGKTIDGGAFSGVCGGIKLNNSLKGISYAIYIRQEGNKFYTGYLRSANLSGYFYPGIRTGALPYEGMFEATGTMSADMGINMNERETTFSPDELADRIIDSDNRSIGSIEGGVFSGYIESNSIHLENETWDLWTADSGGTYTSLPTANWHADMGGRSFREDWGENAPIDSYWFGTISGENAWQGNEFSGTIDATVLSERYIGHSIGDALGVYDAVAKTWEALSAGVFIPQEELTSSGRFVAQGWNVGEGSNFDFAGLIGLTGSMWDAEATPFISMGEFTPPAPANPDKQFAWYVKKEWYSGETLKEDGFVSRYHDNPGDPYTYTTYDNGSFYGLSAGVGGDGKLKGKTYALYISPSGDAGVLYGDVNGNYYADIEMYRLDGELVRNFHKEDIGILPADLRSNIAWDVLSGTDDHGGMWPDSDVYVQGFGGTMLNIAGQDWGVWNFVTNGTYEGPTSDIWGIHDLTGTTTPGATSADTSFAGGSWLGGITGTKWNTTDGIEGNLDAIWIGLRRDGTLSGRKINGEVTGNYIEVDEANGTGTWQAGAAGEWVEVNTNLFTGPGLDANIIALGQAANVPIAVAYSSVMTGQGAGIISATMDTRLYNMVGGGDGIWAAIINGYYSTAPTADWTLTVANGADNATLTGSAWSGSQWAANVYGTVGGSAITGQAAGTYTGSETGGTFTGAGTGTYSQS